MFTCLSHVILMFRCSWNECLNGEKYTELRNICAAKQKQKKQKQKQQKKKGGGRHVIYRVFWVNN